MQENFDINNSNVQLWLAMRDNYIKTSQEWQQIIKGIIVVDPDGWDRNNFQYSWFEEKISAEEYIRRVESSTVMKNNKK